MKKTTTKAKKTTAKKAVKATAKKPRAKRVRKAKDLKPIPSPKVGMLLKISEMDQRLITAVEVDGPDGDRVRYVESSGAGFRRGAMLWSKVPKTATVIENWA